MLTVFFPCREACAGFSGRKLSVFSVLCRQDGVLVFVHSPWVYYNQIYPFCRVIPSMENIIKALSNEIPGLIRLRAVK